MDITPDPIIPTCLCCGQETPCDCNSGRKLRGLGPLTATEVNLREQFQEERERMEAWLAKVPGQVRQLREQSERYLCSGDCGPAEWLLSEAADTIERLASMILMARYGEAGEEFTGQP